MQGFEELKKFKIATSETKERVISTYIFGRTGVSLEKYKNKYSVREFSMEDYRNGIYEMQCLGKDATQERALEIMQGIKSKEINLCLTCNKCLGDCKGNPVFGNGKGNDNVIECDKYKELEENKLEEEYQEKNDWELIKCVEAYDEKLKNLVPLQVLKERIDYRVNSKEDEAGLAELAKSAKVSFEFLERDYDFVSSEGKLTELEEYQELKNYIKSASSMPLTAQEFEEDILWKMRRIRQEDFVDKWTGIKLINSGWFSVATGIKRINDLYKKIWLENNLCPKPEEVESEK